MKKEEIIQVLELHLDSLKTNRRKCVERRTYTELTEAVLTTLNHEIQACSEAVEIIKRVPDNEPLALDQLRNMIGQPVWIEEPKLGRAFWAILNAAGDTGFFVTTTEFPNKYVAYSLYGVTWRAYAAVPSPVKQWIGVRDQMPDTGERVLVCCGSFVCEAYCDINGYFHRIPQERWPDSDTPYPITHWMPLPDPPVSAAWLEEEFHGAE